MTNICFQLSPDARAQMYDDDALARIRRRARVLDAAPHNGTWREHRAALATTDVIFSGWGAPRMDEEFLHAAPRLRAVFYAGGSTRHFVTDAFWRRGIRLSSAYAINAIPVSEYTTAVIQLGLKQFWQLARATRERRTFPGRDEVPGALRRTIGLVSYGTIARLVRQRLREHESTVLVYDPHLSATEAQADDVELTSLDDLFARADVVSLHAPLLDETRHLIRERHLRRMRAGGLFINTARGEIVHETELIAVLRDRPDLQAVLDVTDPEPPEGDAALYTLPNVVLTPHIAGSMASECTRLGNAMVDEFERFLNGQQLEWEITPEKAALMA